MRVRDGQTLILTGVISDSDIATVTNAHAGGSDVFIATLSTDLQASANDRLTYFGGAGADTAADVAIKDGKVYVIEANPRASRTVPFIAKAYDEPYVNYATKIMLGEKKVKDFKFDPRKNGYAIKVPVFSFEKFQDVNKELGPEMKSTGEAIYFIDDLQDEFFQKVYSERNLYLSR